MPGHVDRRQRRRGEFRQARYAIYFVKVPYSSKKARRAGASLGWVLRIHGYRMNCDHGWKIKSNISISTHFNHMYRLRRCMWIPTKGALARPTGNHFMRRKSSGFAVSPEAKLILTNQRFGKITAQSGNTCHQARISVFPLFSRKILRFFATGVSPSCRPSPWSCPWRCPRWNRPGRR